MAQNRTPADPISPAAAPLGVTPNQGDIMAEETEEKKTDIFYVQQQMLDTLTDLFMRQDREQVTYVSPAAPLPRSTNYLLYIVLGIGALIFFGKIKL